MRRENKINVLNSSLSNGGDRCQDVFIRNSLITERPSPLTIGVHNHRSAMTSSAVSLPATHPDMKDELDAFYLSISPLLWSMRMFGIHFGKPLFETGQVGCSTGKQWDSCRYYSTIVLVLLWFNTARMVTFFTAQDSPLIVFFKIALIVFMLSANIMMTSYYVACSSGSLHRFFYDLLRFSKDETVDLQRRAGKDVKNLSSIDVMTKDVKNVSSKDAKTQTVAIKEDHGNHKGVVDLDMSTLRDVSTTIKTTTTTTTITTYHRGHEHHSAENLVNDNIKMKSVIETPVVGLPEQSRDTVTARAEYITRWCAIIAWLFIVSNIAFYAYDVFISGESTVLITPLNTHIPVNNYYLVITASLLCIFLFAYIYAAWCFTTAMTVFVSMLLWREFQSFNNRFKSCIRFGSFEGDLDLYRLRHQRLSRLVEKADRIFWISIGGSVVCDVATFVVTLYCLIWGPTFGGSVFIKLALFYYTITTAIHLSITAFSSILVNNSVSHKPRRFKLLPLC